MFRGDFRGNCEVLLLSLCCRVGRQGGDVVRGEGFLWRKVPLLQLLEVVLGVCVLRVLLV